MPVDQLGCRLQDEEQLERFRAEMATEGEEVLAGLLSQLVEDAADTGVEQPAEPANVRSASL